MNSRDELITKKQEVQANIRLLRERAEALRRQAASRGGRSASLLLEQVALLELELEGKMAEESRLRQAVDRATGGR